MEQQYQEPDPRARRRALLTAGFAASIGFLVLLIARHYFDELRNIAENDPARAIEDLRRHIGTIAAAIAAPAVATAMYACWLAVRILRAKRFPPPGMEVVRRVRIERGRRAQAQAIALAALGAVLLALAGATPIVLKRTVNLIGDGRPSSADMRPTTGPPQ